jgi:hypothetical protein
VFDNYVPPGPAVRSITGEVVLDHYIRSRDTVTAGQQSAERAVVGTAVAVTPYSVVRSVPDSQYARLVSAASRVLALRAAANIGASHRQVFVYCDMEGTDATRNFTTDGWGSTGCTLLRDCDNCFALRVAGDDGQLFGDSDYNRVRRVRDSDFSAISDTAPPYYYSTWMSPNYPDCL